MEACSDPEYARAGKTLMAVRYGARAWCDHYRTVNTAMATQRKRPKPDLAQDAPEWQQHTLIVWRMVTSLAFAAKTAGIP